MEDERLEFGKLNQSDLVNEVIINYNPKLKIKPKLRVQPIKGYVSGSIYAGEWSPVDMDGEGSFILPHGVIYEGKMKDGMFHGRGILTYPMGQMVVGEWHEGEIISWHFEYKNIKQCSLDTYCKQPDRRFLTTLYNELRPAGKEYLTNQQPTRKIPKDCYDVGDGFYNPKTLWVHSVNDMGKVLYMPAPRKKPIDPTYFKDDGLNFIQKVPLVPIYQTCQWIEEHCRKAWDQPTEYKPELYEYWYSGRHTEEQNLDMRVQAKGGKFIWTESECDEILKKFEKRVAVSEVETAQDSLQEIVEIEPTKQIEIKFDNLSTALGSVLSEDIIKAADSKEFF